MLLLGLAASAALLCRQLTAGAPGSELTRCHTGTQPEQHVPFGYLQLFAELGIPTSSAALTRITAEDGMALGLAPYFGCISCTIATFRACTKSQQQPNSDVTAGSIHACSSNPETFSLQSKRTHSSTSTQSVLQQLAFQVLHTLKDIVLLLPDTDVKSTADIFWSFSCVLQLFGELPESQAQQQQVLQWLLQPIYKKVCRVADSISQQDLIAEGAVLKGAHEKGLLVMERWAASTMAILYEGETWC